MTHRSALARKKAAALSSGKKARHIKKRKIVVFDSNAFRYNGPHSKSKELQFVKRLQNDRQRDQNSHVLLDLSRENIHDLDTMLLQLIRALFASGTIATVPAVAKAFNVSNEVAKELAGLYDDNAGKAELARRLKTLKPLRIVVAADHDGAQRSQSSNAQRQGPSALQRPKSRSEVFNCSVCRVHITGQESWKNHLAGRKHRAAAASEAAPVGQQQRQHRNHVTAAPQAAHTSYYEDVQPTQIVPNTDAVLKAAVGGYLEQFFVGSVPGVVSYATTGAYASESYEDAPQ